MTLWIKEHFLRMINIDDSTRDSLYKKITTKLEKWSTSVEDMPRQRYDNGANMKGKKN